MIAPSRFKNKLVGVIENSSLNYLGYRHLKIHGQGGPFLSGDVVVPLVARVQMSQLVR